MGKQTYGNSNFSRSCHDHVQSAKSKCSWSEQEQVLSKRSKFFLLRIYPYLERRQNSRFASTVNICTHLNIVY